MSGAPVEEEIMFMVVLVPISDHDSKKIVLF